MNRKRFSWLAVVVMGLCLGGGAVVRADDVPFGYSVVSETPEKGESTRTKILDAKNELVGRKIQKVDGTSELHSFVNGVRTSKVVSDKAGNCVAEFHYYADGKLKRELTRGVLAFERRKLADGTFEAIRYKPDGKSPQMRRRVSTDGAFELTHFRTNSVKIWFSANIKGTSGSFEWNYFAEDGSQLRRVISDKDMVVTVYNQSGNIKLEQVWTKNADGDYVCKSVSVPHNSGYRRYVNDAGGKLECVEDLDADGSVTTTSKPNQVNAPAAGIFAEQFEDDDPTIPEKE
jgi:hypothetical protein